MTLVLVTTVAAATSATESSVLPDANTIQLQVQPQPLEAATGNGIQQQQLEAPSTQQQQQQQSPLSTDDGMTLHVASGAYPVYYGVARSNGRFSKRIRAFSGVVANHNQLLLVPVEVRAQPIQPETKY